MGRDRASMDSPFSFRDDSMVFHAPVQRRHATPQGVALRAQGGSIPGRGTDDYSARQVSTPPYAPSEERSYAPLPALPTVLRAQSHLRSMSEQHGHSPILASTPPPPPSAFLERSFRPLTLSTNSPATKNSLGYILGESRTPNHRTTSGLHGRDDRRFYGHEYESSATSRYEGRAPPLLSAVARGRFASDSSGDSSSYTSSPLMLPRESTRRANPASVRPVDMLNTSATDASKKKRKARICTTEGCTKYVVDHGLCIRHGGGKRCYIDGCDCRAQNRGLCWKHGGFTICKVDGCTKRAKSRGICWSHGGGTRCKREDCSKIAVSNGLCWAHGGGKRCVFGKCRKPASERTNNYCSEHYALEGNTIDDAEL